MEILEIVLALDSNVCLNFNQSFETTKADEIRQDKSPDPSPCLRAPSTWSPNPLGAHRFFRSKSIDWRDRGGELKDARGRVWSLIGRWTASFLKLEAQSLFVTIKQISLLIGYFSDFQCRNILWQVARVIPWYCVTSALSDDAPMNPLIYMFLVEIFAVCKISMVDCNGR